MVHLLCITRFICVVPLQHLYLNLVQPLAPFVFKGMLWYQGESNVACNVRPKPAWLKDCSGSLVCTRHSRLQRTQPIAPGNNADCIACANPFKKSRSKSMRARRIGFASPWGVLGDASLVCLTQTIATLNEPYKTVRVYFRVVTMGVAHCITVASSLE